MMYGGSFLIAILPTYETIGAAAGVLLILIRMVQGLSVGGEYGTTATYMSEIALKNRRVFLAPFNMRQSLVDSFLRAWLCSF